MFPGMSCREVLLFLENSAGNFADDLQALSDNFVFVSCGP